MTLQSYSVKTLVGVLRDLSGGNIGFDPYRDARTNTKQGLISYLCYTFDESAVEAALAEHKPQAMDSEPVASAGVRPKTVGEHLDALLADSRVSEARIREIVREELSKLRIALD